LRPVAPACCAPPARRPRLVELDPQIQQQLHHQAALAERDRRIHTPQQQVATPSVAWKTAGAC